MHEGMPNRKLIDREAEENPRKAPNLDKMEYFLMRGRFDEMDTTLERMKDSFEDFFTRIIEEEPDYVVLLDKGARPFGVPFERYLNTLNLKKKPKVVFWNDSGYKYHNSETESVDEKLSREYKERKDLHDKKLFFVDETFSEGKGAGLLKNFFDRNEINGQYFAFSFAETSDGDQGDDAFDDKFGNDKRFHLYRNNADLTLFTKEVASLYVADITNSEKKTGRRFEYVDTDAPYKSAKALKVDAKRPQDYVPQSQDELHEMKKFAEEIRRKTTDAIYKKLQEMDLHKTKELQEDLLYKEEA
jgi:hypothetical protein